MFVYEMVEIIQIEIIEKIDNWVENPNSFFPWKSLVQGEAAGLKKSISQE